MRWIAVDDTSYPNLGEFNNLTRLQSEVACYVLNRFAGDVTYEIVEPLVRFFENLVHER